MNENETKDELLENEHTESEQTEENIQDTRAEETLTASNEEPKYYIPPHDDGWQPYDPSKTYANNWDSRDKKKNGAGKKALVFGIVMSALVLLCVSGFALSLVMKAIGVPGLLTDVSSSEETEISRAPLENDVSDDDEQTELIPTDNPELNLNITDYDKVTTVYTELYEKCSVSCVSIICSYKNQSGYALGSGFVLSKDGYIATNHHVIEDAEKITVQFYDGAEYEAILIGSDSVTDLAVLRIEAEGLIPAELGDSTKVSVGEPVVAIGTPYDITLAGTMTSGIVSGLARDVECTDDYGNVVKTMTLIQTDSPINPGNSGGPLFNTNGQVIGINTLKLMDEFEGIGFSIPITDAIKVFETLVKYGELPDYGDTDFVKTSPKLHITVMSVSDARNSVEYGRFISKDAPDGVYVIEVTPGTAIYEAGLEIYDIITEFNGVVLEGREDLAAELSKCSAGQEVTIKVYHRGEYKTLTFKLDKAG